MEKEFTGTYPIFIDNRETGELNVNRDGLFWSFEATSEHREDIVRLSVFGQGGEGYLGVMQPRDGFLKLKKRLSRSAAASLPCPITHAGRQGQPQNIQVQPLSAESASRPITPEPVTSEPAASPQPPVTMVLEDTPTAQTCEETPAPTGPQAPGPDCTQTCEGAPAPTGPEAPKPDCPQPEESAPTGSCSPPLVWRPCGCPCERLSSMEAKQLFGSRTNVLEAGDNTFTYLAVPESQDFTEQELAMLPGQAVILGRRYLVCRVKDGYPM